MAINFLAQLTTNSLMQGDLGPLDQVILLLQNFGFFRVILPFLLVFSIVYAVLAKTGVLGENKGAAKSASTIIALVSAFLVIVYTPVVNMLATLLPQASFLLIVVVLLLMVLGLFGIKFENEFTKEKPWWIMIIVIPVVILFIAMIGVAAGPDIPILYQFTQLLLGAIPITGEISADTVALLVGVIIILSIVGGVIYMVTRPEAKD
jgi:magnesium-transporting ATPase (P-type)